MLMLILMFNILFFSTDRKIVRKSLENPHLTAPEIRLQTGMENVSTRTIQRRLNEGGLYGRRPAKKPFLKPRHVKDCLQFAKDHLNWTVENWKTVLWSDESKFNMVCSDGRGYVRRPVGKRFAKEYTIGTVKFGGGNIMVWGCFSWAGIGPLYRVNGIMDQLQYREILSNQMLPHALEKMPHNWVYQHDNDPKHTALTVKNWLINNSITVLKWPAQSPDLNPIENLWIEVERRLGGRKFQKPDELFRAVQYEWEALPKQLLETLVESMPRRCKAVIDSKGYATKY